MESNFFREKSIARTLLLLVAGFAGVLIVGSVVYSVLPHSDEMDSETVIINSEPTETEPAPIPQQEFAFRGIVKAIDDTSVTLLVTTVEVLAPDAQRSESEQVVALGENTNYVLQDTTTPPKPGEPIPEPAEATQDEIRLGDTIEVEFTEENETKTATYITILK